MSRHFSIDSLRIRGHRLFGWGWFLDTDSPLKHAELRVPLIGGHEANVACIEGAAREDVAAAFANVPHASAAGYMLLAALPDNVDGMRPGRFIAHLANDQVHEIDVSLSEYIAQSNRTAAVPFLHRARHQGLGAMLQDLRGRRASLWSRARTRWNLFGMRLRRVVVVFDHGMGGGANSFRRARTNELVARGQTVVLVTPHLAAMEYTVSVCARGSRYADWVFQSQEEMLKQLSRFTIDAVEINNLVTFDRPLEIVDWCVERSRLGARLHFFLHDFHAVCPAFTLIDADGRYCGVPSLDTCRGCLPRNAANSLGFSTAEDTGEWRAAWKKLLVGADSITAFSEASVRILTRAYPDVAGRLRLELRPHIPDHSHLRLVEPGGGDVLTIGVVGNISRAKGARIVERLAALAEEQALSIQIVVIGTLQTGRACPSTLTVHGSYQSTELPDLLERYSVDVCLMPSVCPETYSYVTDEIMAMGMPLAVFDVGAPAERVARYGRGVVMSEITAEAALTDIIRLAKQKSGPDGSPVQEQV